MKIGVVGATGLVGGKLLALLEKSILPIEEIRLIASSASLGKKIKFKNKMIEVMALSDKVFNNLNLVFFMATSEVAQNYVKIALENNCVVIDNSSTFRLNEDVPLVVPEVNFNIITPKDRLIANPNCSTIQLVLTLYALSKINKIKRVDVSTYQAVSGAGKNGIKELQTQIQNFPEISTKYFPYPILYNAIPQIDSFTSSGYTKEELKVIQESQKILNKKFSISCTAVRIPIEVGHSESVSVVFESEVNLDLVNQAFKGTENIIVLDDTEKQIYPLAQFCKDRVEVFVGRIRKDYYNPNILHFWNVADNLTKGAAANALQIAEKCFKEKTFGW